MAVLDNAERYEDSYAITQEFREWITCLGEHPEKIEASTLSVPIDHKKRHADRAPQPKRRNAGNLKQYMLPDFS